MKNLFLVLMLILTAGVIYGCSPANADKNVLNTKTEGGVMKDKKVLIAYYSYSGNTKAVAERIQAATGGDIFEIVPKNDYPKNYNAVVEQAKKEKADNFKPELKSSIDVSKYDLIFIGSPVWWYTMAPPVMTFISENNFDGKTIIPFCTHGGGGASATYIDMEKLAPKAKVLSGLTTYERTATDKEVFAWIKSLKQ